MRIMAGREFLSWYRALQKEGGARLELASSLLEALEALPCKPDEDSQAIKRVQQARRHEVYRISHKYDERAAIRIICWFPQDDTAVVALVGGDKKKLGNVWYTSAAVRAEAGVDQHLREMGASSDRGTGLRRTQ